MKEEENPCLGEIKARRRRRAASPSCARAQLMCSRTRRCAGRPRGLPRTRACSARLKKDLAGCGNGFGVDKLGDDRRFCAGVTRVGRGARGLVQEVATYVADVSPTHGRYQLVAALLFFALSLSLGFREDSLVS